MPTLTVRHAWLPQRRTIGNAAMVLGEAGATEVTDLSAADLRFAIGTGDYDVLALEQVLSDLL